MSAVNNLLNLIAKLESDDKNTRYEASDILVSRGTPAIPYLISKLLYYTKEDARGMALWTIGEICPHLDDPRIDREALSPLIDGLKKHQPNKVRCDAAWALGRLKTNHAMEPLIAALGDDAADVRQAAAEALKMIKDPRGLQALDDIVQDSVQDSVIVSANTLAEARQNLLEKIPSGHFIIKVNSCNSEKKTKRISASTIEKAFNKAKKEIPKDTQNVEERVVRKPFVDVLEIYAFYEDVARFSGSKEIQEEGEIKNIRILEKGKKGLLGIGKKPNLYSIEVFYKAIIEVKYETYDQIEAKITDDKDIANKSLLVNSEEGNFQLVEYLLQQGVDINASNNNGATALILSAFNGYSKVSILLIDNGIDINKNDHGGFNALMVACECANADIKLIKKLIDLGADVNATSGRGSTALMAAAKIGHLDLVELLVSKGAEINARNSDHNITPLIWAANEGHLSIVKFLLRKGADPNILTNNNYTAATIANENGHYSIVEVLDLY